MRGIRDERALRIERTAQARQQCVDRFDQRRHFGGQTGFVHRLQCVGVAPLDFLCQAPDRAQRGADGPPDRQGQDRYQRQDRSDSAQRGLRCQLPSDRQRLRDLDHPVVRCGAEDAPGFVAQSDFGKAEHRAGRQCKTRMRRVDPGSIDAPDLHHEVEVVVGQGGGLVGCYEALIAQRQGHLAQLVVEQRLGLAQYVGVGERGARRSAQQHHRQQRNQQPGPDRFHRLTSGRPT